MQHRLALAFVAALASGMPAQAADWAAGEKLTFINCGRCHVIGERNRMGGIGSTPGFAVIRTWENWEEKMESFYTLNPHPAFTQIEGVTPPFPENRPSPIHPISLTLEQLDIIIDYARTVEPAELGGALR